MRQQTAPDKPAVTIMEPGTLPRLRVIEAEASQYIGMSRPWLRLQRMHGTGPAYIRIGRAIRYDVRDLDVWLSSHRVSCE
jgi:predicted DNA-binding transcriptional regulator AlpA